MMKTLGFFATLCLALPCFALSQMTLVEATATIQGNYPGKLISCSGENSDNYVVVSLPDGSKFEVLNTPLIQAVNSLCDLSAPWSSVASRVVFCYAK